MDLCFGGPPLLHYNYGLIHIYISLYFHQLSSLFFLKLKLTHRQPVGDSLSASCPLDMTSLVYKQYLSLWHKVSQTYLVHSFPLDLGLFPNLFQWEMVFLSGIVHSILFH